MVVRCKVPIMGLAGAGKTSLRDSFVGKEVQANYLMTIGAEFTVKKMKIGSQEIEMIFWDIAGQSRFAFQIERFVQGSVGYIYVMNPNDDNRRKMAEKPFNAPDKDKLINYNIEVDLKEWVLDNFLGNLKSYSLPVEYMPFLFLINKFDLGTNAGGYIEKIENFIGCELVDRNVPQSNCAIYQTSTYDRTNVVEAINWLGTKLLEGYMAYEKTK